ncbi:MAG: hypothetical protein ACQEQF_00140 [Bacillota bacterium]
MTKNQLSYAEELALSDINVAEAIIEKTERKINELKAELGKRGYRVIELYCSINGSSCCIVGKKNKTTREFELYTTAKVSEDDLNIEVFGKYLALSRAVKILLGGNN